MVICPNGHDNPDDYRHCCECGAPIRAQSAEPAGVEAWPYASAEDRKTALTPGAPKATLWPGVTALVIALPALVIALFALAVAITPWLRPPQHSGAPTFTDQQTADAKKSVCTAYASVKQAVITNTHMANPNADDPVGHIAVAANARLTLLGGGQYLRERMAAAPATAPDLAKAITSMANTLEDVGIAYLSGAPSSDVDPLRHNLDSEFVTIDGLCK